MTIGNYSKYFKTDEQLIADQQVKGNSEYKISKLENLSTKDKILYQQASRYEYALARFAYQKFLTMDARLTVG